MNSDHTSSNKLSDKAVYRRHLSTLAGYSRKFSVPPYPFGRKPFFSRMSEGMFTTTFYATILLDVDYTFLPLWLKIWSSMNTHAT